jgi:hypothetical protein
MFDTGEDSYPFRAVGRDETYTNTACPRCNVTLSVGHKCDAGKLAWHLFPFDAVRDVVRVLMRGAKKYTAHNWRAGMLWSRPYDATLRHLDAFWSGEDLDPETGEHHLDHALCELLFLRDYAKRYPENDDRWKGNNARRETVRAPF